MSKTAYIALGSNMGNGEENIKEALKALSLVPGIKVVASSPVYETKPWGYEAQHNFTNAAARLLVEISPETLLGVCLGVEAGMGRIRKFTNGPRIIDIDLIMYENETRNTKELILPHPRMNERDFVLIPLIDVAEEPVKCELKEKSERLSEHYIIK